MLINYKNLNYFSHLYNLYINDAISVRGIIITTSINGNKTTELAVHQQHIILGSLASTIEQLIL